jgi:hypothetical protein
MAKTYTFGNVKLTQQALGVFIIGTLISLYALVTLRSAKGAAFAVGMFAFTCYNTYLNNCLIVGNCKILAWLLLAMSALSALAIPMRLRRI